MFDWPVIFPLVVQAFCTIVAIEQLRRRVFPAIPHLPSTEIVTDVWAPLAMVIPLLFFTRQVQSTVHGAGWLAVGAPALCGVFGLAAALVKTNAITIHAVAKPPLSRLAIAVWTGAGLVLWLLGMAHDLTLWVGQCAFAIGAVLLWLNSAEEQPSQSPPSAIQMRAGLGLTVALMAAVGQGVASLYVDDRWIAVSGGMMIAGAAMIAASAARAAGAWHAVRIGGWAASFGIVWSLGLISLLRLVPEAISLSRSGETRPIMRVAYGFGEYWIESLCVLLLASAAFIFLRQSPARQRGIGFIILIGAAILAAWRLAKM